MAESVLTEQGATSMPSTLNDPLAMVAPMSLKLCTCEASERTCSSERSVSSVMVRPADGDSTR